MTDAELIDWAANQVGWEFSESAQCFVTPPLFTPTEGSNVVKKTPEFHGAGLDALTLQLWRKWCPVYFHGGFVSSKDAAAADRIDAALQTDSLACIRAIHESGVL
ncbi:MAG: hypothetical protein AAFW75_27125 [Cyanobacteria bacterium J06636_16]